MTAPPPSSIPLHSSKKEYVIYTACQFLESTIIYVQCRPLFTYHRYRAEGNCDSGSGDGQIVERQKRGLDHNGGELEEEGVKGYVGVLGDVCSSLLIMHSD